jgi:HEAT repeat protein
MPFLIEHITEVVFILLIIIVLGNILIVGLTISRRQQREKYFRKIDGLRAEYGPVIDGLLSGESDYAEGIRKLKSIGGIDRLYMLERLCIERRPAPEKVPNLRKICEDLGLVEAWQRRLSGVVDVASVREAVTRPEGVIERVGRLRFLIRAKSAENLGIVRHRGSWPLLVKALDDPHPDLQSVASRALAAIREPASFQPLVVRLHAVIEKPESALSLRSIKSALVSFPLTSAPGLLASLTHANRRIRFLATDIIREMVERETALDQTFELDRKSFGVELTEAFLAQLPFDENPDVRARSASVISSLADPRSAPVLLTLLHDGTWFVRLHAVRALSKRKFLPHASKIAQSLSDPQWRVREATVSALREFGSVGAYEMTAHFLSTNDQYSREQIADEIQRTGLLTGILRQYAAEGDEKAGQVVRQLAEMGKTSYVVGVLTADSDVEMRKRFLEILKGSPDGQIRTWIQHLAAEESDPKLRSMAQAAVTAKPASRGN